MHNWIGIEVFPSSVKNDSPTWTCGGRVTAYTTASAQSTHKPHFTHSTTLNTLLRDQLVNFCCWYHSVPTSSYQSHRIWEIHHLPGFLPCMNCYHFSYLWQSSLKVRCRHSACQFWQCKDKVSCFRFAQLLCTIVLESIVPDASSPLYDGSASRLSNFKADNFTCRSQRLHAFVHWLCLAVIPLVPHLQIFPFSHYHLRGGAYCQQAHSEEPAWPDQSKILFKLICITAPKHSAKLKGEDSNLSIEEIWVQPGEEGMQMERQRQRLKAKGSHWQILFWLRLEIYWWLWHLSQQGRACKVKFAYNVDDEDFAASHPYTSMSNRNYSA